MTIINQTNRHRTVRALVKKLNNNCKWKSETKNYDEEFVKSIADSYLKLSASEKAVLLKSGSTINCNQVGTLSLLIAKIDRNMI